jgi:UDP-galactopyranose mutase
MEMKSVLVIGAGISGLAAARLLKDRGWDVEVLDQKPYLGGCCADQYMLCGFVHLHGPHIIHTDDEEVWKFFQRFAFLPEYQHKVVAVTSKGIIPVPFDEDAVRIVGRDLSTEEIVDLVYRGYTRKMWGKEWEAMPESFRNGITKKRGGKDGSYTGEKYQGLPRDGYSAMFGLMASGFKVVLGAGRVDRVSLDKIRKGRVVIHCGRPNDVVGLGPGWADLTYRSLRFEWATAWDGTQGIGEWVVNDCTDALWTRTSDYYWMPGNSPGMEVSVREFPCDWESGMEPYYPVETRESTASWMLMAKELEGASIHLLGRVGRHKYISMGQAVRDAMDLARKLDEEH